MSDTAAARKSLIAAWRDASVAGAAGVSAITWADTDESVGHVFSLASPGGINRGRLPLVQLIFNGQLRDYETDEGGISQMSYTARIVVGGVSNATNLERAEGILQAGVDATRNARNLSGMYWHIADDSVTQHEVGPCYHVLETTITCETTWEREH